MPAIVRKHKGHWDIVDADTGALKGHSTTRAKAQASANARNAAIGGKRK